MDATTKQIEYIHGLQAKLRRTSAAHMDDTRKLHMLNAGSGADAAELPTAFAAVVAEYADLAPRIAAARASKDAAMVAEVKPAVAAFRSHNAAAADQWMQDVRSAAASPVKGLDKDAASALITHIQRLAV